MPRNIDLDDPNMSDKTLLVSVEDLIELAMGPQEENLVDFKLIQTVLNILARQMRLLELKVAIEIGEPDSSAKSKKKKEQDSGSQPASDESRRSRSKRDIGPIKEEPEPSPRRKSKDRDTERGDKGKGGKEKGEKGKGEKEKGEKEKGEKGKEEKGKGEKEKVEKEKGEKEKGEKGKGEKGKGEKEKEDKGKEEKGKGEKGKVEKGKVEKEKGGQDRKEKAKEDEAAARRDRQAELESAVRKQESTPAQRKKGGERESGRRASIEVVTQAQFAMLEAAVKALQGAAAPPPAPALPDNKKLRTDLAKGTASLTDTMQAMQVSARVQAAEQAIGRLGGLLTQLAAAGDIIMEDDFEQDTLAAQDKARTHSSVTSRKSVMIKESPSHAKPLQSQASAVSHGGQSQVSAVSPGGQSKGGMSLGGVSIMSARPSMTSKASMSMIPVTHPEMSEAISNLRTDLLRQMNNLTGNATTTADGAANAAKAVAEKLAVAMGLNERINGLQSMVADYSEQLTGFDAGLTTQLTSFQEQMALMRTDMSAGLAQLENANNNADTAEMSELTERYTQLVEDLDHILLAHQALTSAQNQVGVDLRSLAECVEMLREQKADRDEVLDGLRDKADNARLAGLLTQEEFQETRVELERRLDLCHDKFQRQEEVWMTALKDLMQVSQTKADLMELLKMRDEATIQLQDIDEKIKKLGVALGEPKAAILTRKLARGAVCGACMVPALMDPEDAAGGKPPALPAALPAGPRATAEEPCERELLVTQRPDLRTHTCKRFVGGSHTMLTEVRRGPSLSIPEQPGHTRKFQGVGDDGRLYLMETELQPCLECNQLALEAPPAPAQPEEGAGDTADRGVAWQLPFPDQPVKD